MAANSDARKNQRRSRHLFASFSKKDFDSASDPVEDINLSKEVLDDICARFICSLPDELKPDNMRICFEVELAFWFYLDNYCDPSVVNVNNKSHRKHFRSFARHIFQHVDFLRPRLPFVEQILRSFVEYKFSIPVRGAILLDKTLNYVLLVQGFYASKGAWGFPKGKMNEEESAVECAIREVYEEIGYDIRDKIVADRYIYREINVTPTQLFIVKDVEIDFPFKPHVDHEIRRIQWFSVWDLPVNRVDREACARFDLKPNNFYTVSPFIGQLQRFIRNEQMRNQKPSNVNIGTRTSSAFMPVVPRRSLQSSAGGSAARNPGSLAPEAAHLSPLTINTQTESLFKPLQFSSSVSPLTNHSFTGESFLQMITNMQSPLNVHVHMPNESVRAGDIKHPKPIHPSKLVILAYEVPEDKLSPDSVQSYAYDSGEESLNGDPRDLSTPASTYNNALPSNAFPAAVFSKTSAFTPVKSACKPSGSQWPGAIPDEYDPLAVHAAAVHQPSRQPSISRLIVPEVWVNFRLNTERLLAQFNEHMQQCNDMSTLV